MLNLLTIIAFFCQIILDYSFNNVISNVLAALSFSVALNSIFIIRNRSFPSAFIGAIVFLIISANSIAPIIGTLIDGNTLVYSLITPVETYFHRLVFAILLVISFNVASNRSGISLNESMSNLSLRMGLNYDFSAKAVWCFGLFGLASFFLKFAGLPDVLGKIVDAFQFMTWAPFIMVVKQYEYKTSKQFNNRLLAIYYLFMILMSLVTNSRMAMLGPIGVILSTWLLLLINGKVIIDTKLLRRGLIISIVGLFVLGVFLDISTAILMSRKGRATASFDEIVTDTYKNFQDKEALDRFRVNVLTLDEGLSATAIWQENYLRNPFLGRFVQIKFDDNLFYRVSLYSNDTKALLRQITIDKVLVIFPQPILNLFNVTLEKKYLNSFSTGDIMDVLSGQGFLGGFKTGSIPANGYAIMGWWYPLCLFVIYYFIFAIYAGLVSLPAKYFIRENPLSTLGLILPFSIFLGISLDGIQQLTSVLLRTIIQTVLLYSIALKVFKRMGIK